MSTRQFLCSLSLKAIYFDRFGKVKVIEAMSAELSDITSINRIASYLKVPAGKVAVNNENVCCLYVRT